MIKIFEENKKDLPANSLSAMANCSSAKSHNTWSPSALAGRVESSSVYVIPNTLYTKRMKSRAARTCREVGRREGGRVRGMQGKRERRRKGMRKEEREGE